jgi:NAD(P)-dependent dehydrogenase (short-subunit alcohol dehydrogenase family)
MVTLFIVGGGRGVGRGLVQACLDRYPSVRLYVATRQPMTFSETCSPYQTIVPIVWDPEDPASYGAMVDTIRQDQQPLNQAIITVGALHSSNFSPEKTIRRLTAAQMAWSFQVNTIYPSLLIAAIAPIMTSVEPSCLAVLSARVGSITDNQLGGWYSYRAAKAALNMVIKTAAIEYSRTVPSLTLLGIHPGTVDTDLSKPFQKNSHHTLFTPVESANHILDVMRDRLGESGGVFDWKGERVPA